MQVEIEEPENQNLEESFLTLRVNDPASEPEQELEVSFSHLAVVDAPGSPVLTPSTSEEDVNKTIHYYNQVDDEEERENKLEEIFDGIDIELEALDTDLEIDRTDIPDFQNMSPDDSFDITPIVYDEEDDKQDHILRTLGFEKFTPPMMLPRHPPPATRRDDDIGKLRQILDDILVKTDHASNLHNHE
ncbi:unnamed protein product [Mytilus coruscus]|uniref:Uncharacterized protein n=1 Tax=Mytilus coruscus TaxID=42192 RepID=A0A6J8E841_MYTCO|nr:unnamed protein product [Mytilus coruscus]